MKSRRIILPLHPNKPTSQNHMQYITPPENRISKPRVDYIDLLKGITILWIIWIHTDCPDFGNFTNPVFFFASGIFFKLTDIKTFLVKRWYAIIIPFLFFYVASIPFRIIVDYWDYRDLSAFDWGRILELFYVMPRTDYLSLNVPLWFLLCLFFMQLIGLGLFRLNKWIILSFCIVTLIFSPEIRLVPTPFMISGAIGFFGYFGLGYLLGKPLINYMANRKRQIIVLLTSLLILIGTYLFKEINHHTLIEAADRLKQLSFVVAFMTFFSFLDSKPWLSIIRFFGKESLIVLGAHLWILIPLERIAHKFFDHNPLLGFILAVITAAILIPTISILKSKLPLLVGKRILSMVPPKQPSARESSTSCSDIT